MSKPPKLNKDMLAKDYVPAKQPKGERVELDGGRLQTRAAFTTSAKKQEAAAEKRKESGSHFGDRVTVVSPAPTDAPPGPPKGRLDPLPRSINYDRPYSHLTDRQKALFNENLKHNEPVVIKLSDRKNKKRTWER